MPHKNEKDAASKESFGAAKRSAARAKPARAIATGVRVETGKRPTQKTTSLFGKSESKESKEQSRQQRGLTSYAVQILCSENPEYNKNRRIWWILFGTGFVLAMCVAVIVYLVPKPNKEAEDMAGVASLVVMVITYIFIFGSMIWDWLKVRKIRFAIEDKVNAMTAKKRQQIIDNYEAAKAERKEARKAARRTKG